MLLSHGLHIWMDPEGSRCTLEPSVMASVGAVMPLSSKLQFATVKVVHSPTNIVVGSSMPDPPPIRSSHSRSWYCFVVPVRKLHGCLEPFTGSSKGLDVATDVGAAESCSSASEYRRRCVCAAWRGKLFFWGMHKPGNTRTIRKNKQRRCRRGILRKNCNLIDLLIKAVPDLFSKYASSIPFLPGSLQVHQYFP